MPTLGILGLERHHLQDRPGRSRGDRGRQRRRQEHVAAAPGEDLSADFRTVSSIRGSVAPLIEMGAGFNPELSGQDNIILNGAMLGFSRSPHAGHGGPDSRVHGPARIRRDAAQVLFERNVHAAGLCDRHRGRPRHPLDRRIAGRRRRGFQRQSQGPPSRACSNEPRRWSSFLTRWTRCASCAPAGSGSSTAGWWPTARSTRSSTATLESVARPPVARRLDAGIDRNRYRSASSDCRPRSE